MPKKKASGWDRPGLPSGGSGIGGLQTAGKMPPDEIGEHQAPGSPGRSPPARAPPGPLCPQPAPLGRTSQARRPLLCALEVPLVHPVSLASYEDRHLLLQPCLNRGWRGATAGDELKGVPLSDCMIKQKCTM